MGDPSGPRAEFRYTGAEQTWTVPAGVHRVGLLAQGGGAHANGYYLPWWFGCYLDVTPGDVWKIKVGAPPTFLMDTVTNVAVMATAGGWPNGGDGGGGFAGDSFFMGGTGGGGSTSIRLDGDTDPFAVAPGTGGPPGLARLRQYDLDAVLTNDGTYNVDLDSVTPTEFLRFAGQARPGPGAGQRAPRAAPDPTYSGDPLRSFSPSSGNAGGADNGAAGITVAGYGTGGGGGGWGGGASGPYYHASGGINVGTDGLGHPIDELGGVGDLVGTWELDYEGNGRSGGFLIPVASTAVLGTDYGIGSGSNATGIYSGDEERDAFSRIVGGLDPLGTRVAHGSVLIVWNLEGHGWSVGHKRF